MKKYEKSCEDAQNSIHLKHTWIKGWYRAACCLYELGNKEACRNYLYGGLGIAPNNVEMKALMEKLPPKDTKIDD